MRVWLVPYLMCPRALVLCLEEANFGGKFLTENYSKKKELFKTESILEKCEVCFRGTFFNHLFWLKKVLWKLEFGFGLRSYQKCVKQLTLSLLT